MMPRPILLLLGATFLLGPFAAALKASRPNGASGSSQVVNHRRSRAATRESPLALSAQGESWQPDWNDENVKKQIGTANFDVSSQCYLGENSPTYPPTYHPPDR